MNDSVQHFKLDFQLNFVENCLKKFNVVFVIQLLRKTF